MVGGFERGGFIFDSDAVETDIQNIVEYLGPSKNTNDNQNIQTNTSRPDDTGTNRAETTGTIGADKSTACDSITLTGKSHDARQTHVTGTG